MTKLIQQGQTIGIIGGGQLGQMLALDAKASGMRVIVLDPDPTCPTGQVCDEQIVAPYASQTAITTLAEKSDVLTYEFENVDLATLEAVSDQVFIPQGTELLRITKDRLREKTFLRDHGLQTAPFRMVNTQADLVAALADLDYPAILKTCQGGYDGKDQVTLYSEENLKQATEVLAQGPCILEGFVTFKCECSIMVARNPRGQVSVMPVSENIHVNHILHESIVPARISLALQAKAQKLAQMIAEALGLVGILGVEFFVGQDHELYVNELAPRPHNSGHYSLEACDFSQFALHNSAICNWPLPSVKLLSPAIMVNILGQHVAGTQALISQKATWHFHDYGKKDQKFNRKMGHVTILCDNIEETLKEIKTTQVWER